MKKFFAAVCLTCMSLAAMAQSAVITFDKMEHDFGTVHEEDGKVTTIFTFKNEGMEPLILNSVRASCGCTTPKYPHEPIEPGQTGDITVTYNPNGRPGRFNKTVTVQSNATPATTKLYIRGEVLPKPAKPANQYPVTMGELSMKSNQINFGTVIQGNIAERTIEYANNTDHVISVDVAPNTQEPYIEAFVSLTELQPNQTGTLTIRYNTLYCPVFGPNNNKVYMVLNNKRVLTDEYQVLLSADMQEDFTLLTNDERRQAPIADVPASIDLGKFVHGKKHKATVSISNSGANALLVRRALVSEDSHLHLTAPKAIKSGKKADIRIEIDATQLEPGVYKRNMLVITNDPDHSRPTVSITYTIE